MFAQTFQIGDYVPAFGSEQVGKALEQSAIVDGRNFAWTLNGVFSAHAGYRQGYALAMPMRHPHMVTIANRQYVLSATGVWRYDEIGDPERMLTLNANVTHAIYDLDQYQWTQAYVGTRWWFAHPRHNALIYYDQHDNVWGTFRDTCWDGPIYAVTHADNRLVVLLEDVVVWSRFDRGELFGCADESDWRCGSGAQSLALIRYGQPYAVMPYNNGWITFTSMGMMVSAPTQQQVRDPDLEGILVGPVVYHHDEASWEAPPVGPAAIAHVDEAIVVWLSARGLHQFKPQQGGGFGGVEPFQPEMGQFYAEQLIPAAMRENAPLDHFALNYVPSPGWLFLSSRSDFGLPYYDRAHVFQFLLEKWGSFDRGHLTFGDAGPAEGAGDRALQQLADFGYSYLDQAARLIVVDHTTGNPDSFVRFSPVRLQLPQEDLPPATMISVQQVRLGLGPGPTIPRVPFALQSSWEREAYITARTTNCRVLLSGGWDDRTQNDDEGEYAQLVDRSALSAIYACHVTGITHTLVLTALDEDQHFHIRHVELGFFWAGVK